VVGNPKPRGALPSGGEIHDSITMSTFGATALICHQASGVAEQGRSLLAETVFYTPFDSLKFAAFCCDLRIVCTGNNT
jgi:hypothetical protein